MFIYDQAKVVLAISVAEKKIIAAQTEHIYRYYENKQRIVSEIGPYWPEDSDYIQQIKRK
jgi:hypothetical protein